MRSRTYRIAPDASQEVVLSRKGEHGEHIEARRESTRESPLVRRFPTPGRDVRIDNGAWSARIHPEGRRAAQRQATALHQLRRDVNEQRAVTTVPCVVARRRCLASPGLVLRELEDVLFRENSDLSRRRRRRSGEAASEGVGIEAHPRGAWFVLDGAEGVQVGGGEGWLRRYPVLTPINL